MNLPEIQEALREASLDGWLFYDHHHRDPLAYRILGLPDKLTPSRRWYYFIPAFGDPAGLVSRIEPGVLDTLPGRKARYSTWKEQSDELSQLLSGAKRIAMQHSPRCAVPYVAMVDGGTLELVQSMHVEIASSADLVQLFEARWTAEQLESHLKAGKLVDTIRRDAFLHIGDALRAGARITEWDVAAFIRQRFEADGLTTDHGPIVGVNANASNPHYEPTPEHHTDIRVGDLALIDLWAKSNSPNAVYYDITWVGFCGPVPPSSVEKVFEVVAGARDRAVEFVQNAVNSKQQIRGFQVDDAARSHIASAGFGEYFVHRTGHSIGQDVHGAGANMDNFETHDERRVLANTCFSVEPGVYLPEFGIRSEVNVYVSEASAGITGEVQRELVRIAV